MNERWAVFVYDGRNERGEQVASRTSETFPDQKQAEAYRDATVEFHRGIVQQLPMID